LSQSLRLLQQCIDIHFLNLHVIVLACRYNDLIRQTNVLGRG
jgi:hypothetical protein